MNAPRRRVEPWMLWLTALVLGCAFFFQAHDVRVSLYEEYAPWAAAGTAKAVGGNLVKGLVLGSIAALGALLLIQKGGQRLYWDSWFAVLIVLTVLWCAASLSWSVDRGMALRQLVVLSFCLISALGIARHFGAQDLVRLAFLVSGTWCLIGLVAEICLGTFRPWEAGYRFAGTLHPNGQGVQLAILTMACICLAAEARERRGWFVALACLALALALLTKSRTACGSLLAALLVLGMLRAQPRLRWAISALGIWLVFTTGFLFALSANHPERQLARIAMLGRGDESAALTGRLPIWNELLRYVRQRPWTGYGYRSFWNPVHIAVISDELDWLFREGHSGYLDSILGIGLVGTGLLLSCVLMALWAGVRRGGRAGPTGLGHAFTAALLLLLCLVSLLESGMLAASFPSLLAGCCICRVAFEPESGPMAEGEAAS